MRLDPYPPLALTLSTCGRCQEPDAVVGDSEGVEASEQIIWPVNNAEAVGPNTLLIIRAGGDVRLVDETGGDVVLDIWERYQLVPIDAPCSEAFEAIVFGPILTFGATYEAIGTRGGEPTNSVQFSIVDGMNGLSSVPYYNGNSVIEPAEIDDPCGRYQAGDRVAHVTAHLRGAATHDVPVIVAANFEDEYVGVTNIRDQSVELFDFYVPLPDDIDCVVVRTRDFAGRGIGRTGVCSQ